MRILVLLAVLTGVAHADERSFTCKDLTTKNVYGWKGTIAITWSASAAKTHDQYAGHVSYTVPYSNDRLRGVTVTWGGFTDSWQGEKQTGTGTYSAAVFGYAITSDGPLLDPDTGHWDGLGIDPHDQIQVDTTGCRYAFHAGAAMHYKGDTAHAGMESAAGRLTAVGFSGTIPPQPIPAEAKELTGSATIMLPGRRFDLLNSFYYVAHIQDLETASGSVTITWKLVPQFERPRVKIESAALFDITNLPLEFLSASPCSVAKCGGNPRVNGTVAITGDEQDRITEVALEVLERGTVVARGALVKDLQPVLLTTFGPAKRLEVGSPRKMFEFTADELSKIDQNTDARLELQIAVKTKQGGNDTYSAARVPKLVAYTRGNRNPNFGSDANKGGDLWVKPSVRDVYAGMGNDYVWSDFSNMNGGTFYPPHKSHNSGNDVDGVFADGSIEHDWAQLHHHTARTAQRLLALLNDPNIGPRLICVFLAFDHKASDPFWMAIRDVTLLDGRKADGVFVSKPTVGDHETHFHFRIIDVADKTKYKACRAHIVDGVP